MQIKTIMRCRSLEFKVLNSDNTKCSWKAQSLLMRKQMEDSLAVFYRLNIPYNLAIVLLDIYSTKAENMSTRKPAHKSL